LCLAQSDIWNAPNYDADQRNIYLNNADAFIIMYSITAPASLSAFSEIRDVIQAHGQEDAIKVVRSMHSISCSLASKD
jgi:hypothetical protein